jgi:hypothetical protein
MGEGCHVADERGVSLTAITIADLPFLVVSGLDRERVGVQYPRSDYRKQFKIAPLRYFRTDTRHLSRIVRVEGRRAGYVGLNPLSRNIEYYLQPWARGGVGRRAIEEYLREVLPFDVDKHAFMLDGNDRSVHVFRTALALLGLLEKTDFEYFVYPGGSGFRLLAGARPRRDPD